MQTKICKSCGKELPLDAFHMQSNGIGGRYCRCKECVSIKNKISAEKRKVEPKECEKRQIILKPYAYLIAKILEQAESDWHKNKSLDKKALKQKLPKRAREAYVTARMLGFESPREELLNFFLGIWFEEWALFLKKDPDKIRKSIGCPI